MIELCDEIDEYLWIDDTIPLEFDFFAIDDDILEYIGAHLELLKSNKKRQPNYVLSQYGYFRQEIFFNEVFHVQQIDEEDVKY